jgi:hypothetical protein
VFETAVGGGECGCVAAEGGVVLPEVLDAFPGRALLFFQGDEDAGEEGAGALEEDFGGVRIIERVGEGEDGVFVEFGEVEGDEADRDGAEAQIAGGFAGDGFFAVEVGVKRFKVASGQFGM